MINDPNDAKMIKAEEEELAMLLKRREERPDIILPEGLSEGEKMALIYNSKEGKEDRRISELQYRAWERSIITNPNIPRGEKMMILR